MKIALLTFLISLQALALDCGGIPEGQTFRLDSAGGPLEKAAIQDQDGVGSCYANQASLLLQSVLPENPNLSYLNLALYYTNDKSLAGEREKGNKLYTRVESQGPDDINPEGSVAIWGGFACQTIEAAKERQKQNKGGSLCKAEDVSLEHSFFNSAKNAEDLYHEQEKSILSASRYMNSYQQRFGFAYEKDQNESFAKKREEADRFASALKNFVKNSSDSFFVEKCSQNNPEKVEQVLVNALIRLFNSHPECLANGSLKASGGPVCKSMSQFGFASVLKFNNSSEVNFILRREHRTKLNKLLPSLFANKSGPEKFNEGLVQFIKQVDRSQNTQANKLKFLNELKASISPEDQRVLNNEYDRIALGKIDECKAKNVLAYFKDKKAFLEAAQSDSVLCNYSDLLNRAKDLASVLPAKAFQDMSSFVDFITAKAGLNYDEAMLSLMARDCSVEKRVSIPETLSCNPNRISFTSDDFEGMSRKTNFESTVLENRKRMFESLTKKRAVGLDICTKFWKDPSYDFHKENSSTKYATCSNSGNHGFHAITMIGYRCKDNKLQYLAQNSWGPNWKLQDSPYEIENGKIWMDEEKLFMNLDNINYISQ